MFIKRMGVLALSGALVAGSVGQAMADADGLVGGIIGGIIGGAIVNEGNRHRTTTRAAPVRTGISSAQREQNREVQVALNYFGFPVGAPDGALGSRSRAAIGQYQAVLGYAPTGQLTDYERVLLVGSYQRALAGGNQTMQLAAANPMGLKGLLVSWRDEAAGVSVPAPVPLPAPVLAPPVAVAAPAPVPAPAMPQLAAAPAPEMPALPAFGGQAAAAAPGLPNFMGAAAGQASLASYCNKVNLVTSTNGGFVTLASMSDPSVALGEQFCLARTYSISAGEELIAKLAGFTPDQVAAQCEGFGPALKDQVAALSLQPRDEVLRSVSAFALSSGMAPAQLAGTAKICLSVGYRTDNMDVAVGSALLLVALGDQPYGELLGHHLALGYGASARPDLAVNWYSGALDALAKGTPAVFAPAQPERNDLIRKAAFTLGGRSDLLGGSAPVPAALPSFGLTVPGAPAANP
ncbi:peptidoglycan-binding domain-containing protein [Phaeovulum sp. W22_SRMD_FR3]|uniref:peptidoglycan-binding domain-containing protein n=1 Tax=Phaeovulum sp. W22_SRMD_FR3 TaxID=3240274 RepID=UPI003F9443FF